MSYLSLPSMHVLSLMANSPDFFLLDIDVLLFVVAESVPCKYEGRWYQPGQKFKTEGCKEECSCTPQGHVFCKPVDCNAPLFRKGRLLPSSDAFSAAPFLFLFIGTFISGS